MVKTSADRAETRLVRASWVLPGIGPPLDGGAVRICDARIVEVGRFPREPALDLGDAVLIPALVNAHTHLEFSDCKRPLGTQGDSLPAWIRTVIAERKRGNRRVEAAIAAGRAESLKWGVTALGEISTAAPSAYASSPAAPRMALFHEVMGFSTLRADSALRHALDRWNVSRDVRCDEPLPGISPHAPYTVHPRLLAAVADAAQARDFPIAMHLAESREELELLATGAGPFRDLLEERSMWDSTAIRVGSRPFDYLRLLARAPRALVVHGNYLAPEEIEWIGQQEGRLTVIFCPRTHSYFAHEPYPLAQLIAAGVRVALGTDSRASSPDLDVLAELRQVGRRYPEIAPQRLLQMATCDAAEALGLGKEAGRLAPGQRADLLELRSTERIVDPTEMVVRHDALERRVWYGGACHAPPFTSGTTPTSG